MKSIIIGYGEVGKSHEYCLSKWHQEIYYKDKGAQIYLRGEEVTEVHGIELMMVATQCDAKNTAPFVQMVAEYAEHYKPKYINVLTTVPPGTCEAIADRLPFCKVSHSTTRGLHPHLERGLMVIPKHIGGEGAEVLKDFFELAGWTCHTHKLSRTTEVAHLLNNIAYGVNIKLADELNHLCRQFGVDYMESVIAYTQSNNVGYSALDHNSKCRMILNPPFGSIGGHCVIYSASCIPTEYLDKAPMVKGLAEMAQGVKDYGK